MPGSRYDNNTITLEHYTTFKRVPQEKLDSIPAYDYQVKVGERLDQIAFKNYGNGKFWWIIALVNNVGFEFSDISVGKTIKIPFSTEDVFKLL